MDRLIHLFKTMGHKEFRFSERFGGVFGFVAGAVQVALFGLFAKAWTMPPVGAVVGLGTKWLATQTIFRPQEPAKSGSRPRETLEALAQVQVTAEHVARIQGWIVQRVVEVASEVSSRLEEFVGAPGDKSCLRR